MKAFRRGVSAWQIRNGVLILCSANPLNGGQIFTACHWYYNGWIRHYWRSFVYSLIRLMCVNIYPGVSLCIPWTQGTERYHNYIWLIVLWWILTHYRAIEFFSIILNENILCWHTQMKQYIILYCVMGHAYLTHD